MNARRRLAAAAAFVVLGAGAASLRAWHGSQVEVPREQGAPESFGAPVPVAPGAQPLGSVATTTLFGSTFRPNQSPFLLERGGRVLLGCLESEPAAGDRVELRDVTAVKGRADDLAILRPKDARAEIVRPVGALDGDGRLIAIWTELGEAGPQLRTARAQDGAFGPEIALTSGPPAANPEATTDAAGRVWIVFERDVEDARASDGRPLRTHRDVFLAPLEESGLGAPIRVGGGRFGDLDACVASAGSRLWVVWSSYRGRDYEVMARSYDLASGTLGPEIDVSSDSGADDLHPTLAVSRAGEPWIAWDRVEVSDRGDSAPPALRVDRRPVRVEATVRCASVRDGEVLVVKSSIEGVPDGVVPGAPLHSTGGGLPHLAFDGDDRLWIAYRYLHRVSGSRSRHGFPVIVQWLGASGWSPPREIADSTGMPEAPALAGDGQSVVIAFQCDDRAEMSRRQRERMPPKALEPLIERGLVFSRWNGISSIGLARAKADGPAKDAGAPALVPRVARLEPPHFHPAAERLDDPIVLGDAHFEITRGEQRFRVFWGDLHRHSSISRCSAGFEPGPADRWASGRDVHLCDFMALTDHTGALEPASWWQLDKLGGLYRSKGFCTLLGWEWSTDAWGHHNVILRGRMTPLVGERDSITTLFERLPAGDCVTIPHHSSYAAFPNGFDDVDDRFTRLIEVYQACRGNFEFDGCFKQSPSATTIGSFVQDAFTQGHRFGIIASTDHGNGQAYACVLAERLERQDVFEALHARRTYGATAKGMLVDFRVGDALMGEETTVAGPPKLSLHVQGTAELADVVVFKDGRVLRSLREGPARLATSFAPVRLLLEVTPAPGDRLALEVAAAGGKFEPLVLRTRTGVTRHVPGWKAHGERATFELPAELPAEPARFPIHVFVPDGVSLTLEGPDGERGLEASAGAAPVAGVTAGGTKWSLALELGDAAVDLARGLGTREYRGEWLDEEPVPKTPGPTDGREPGPASSWYYARVIQVDGEIAWSSPIFVTRRAAAGE